jgi:hypothetical protein
MASIISAGTTSGTALNMAGDTSGVLQLATNGSTTALTIDTSQRVGIGTASPAVPLHISSSGNGTKGRFTNGTTTLDLYCGGSEVYVGTSGSTTSWAFDNSNTYMASYVNGSERMRIDSSGNMFLGKTADSSAVQGLSFFPSGNIQSANNGSGTVIHYEFYRSGSRVGRIETTASATAYVTSSDYRLKEDIMPMVGALDKVAQLKPVTYKWKVNGADGQGFIAHELQEVIPDCVSGQKDAVNEDGSIDPQGIDTSFLVATLTAAIQEQQTIINDLKARITALEGAA